MESQQQPTAPISVKKLRSVAEHFAVHLKAAAQSFRDSPAGSVAPTVIAQTPLGETYFSRGRKSPDLLSLARFDGLWLEDRLVVFDIGLGNGELLNLIFQTKDQDSSLASPWEVYLSYLLGTIENPSRSRFALFSLTQQAHSLAAPKIEQCQSLLSTKAIRSDLVDETMVTTDGTGQLRLKSDGSRFDLVIGLTKFEALWEADSNDFSLAQKEIISELPLVHPLACWALERQIWNWLPKGAVGLSEFGLEYSRGASKEAYTSIYLVDGKYAGSTCTSRGRTSLVPQS